MRNPVMLFIVILLILFGCYFIFGVERSNVGTKYGRFVYLEYMERDRLKWDGGTTRLTYAEICRDDGALCFGGKRFSVVSQKDGSFIAAKNEDEIHLFDSKIGTEIICLYSNELRNKIRDGATMSWLSKGRLLVISQVYDELNWIHHAVLLDTKNKACIERTVLDMRQGEAERFVDDAISPDASSYSWITCLEGCTIFWLNGDFIKINSRLLDCNAEEIFDIGWEGTLPIAVPYPNAMASSRCTDILLRGDFESL